MDSEHLDKKYLKTLTVLSVEDDEETSLQAASMFSYYCASVLTAKNGEEGLAVFTAQRPDIVITDINMPIMDGLAMAAAIRKIDGAVPIVILTAFEQISYLKQALDLGIDKYIFKPLSHEQLQQTLYNCTHRIRIERALKESDERFRLMFHRSPDAHTLVSGGIYVDCNEAAEQLFHCTRQHIVGQKQTELHPEFQPDGRLSSDILPLILAELNHSGKHSFEWQYQRPDGSRFFADVSIVLLALGGEPQLYASIRDSTARKQDEEELRRAKEIAVLADQAKSRLLLVVAHEFRTPLGLLTISSGILDRYWERLSHEELVGQREQLHRATVQLSQLVDSVLDISRQGVLKSPESPVQIAIEPFCRTVAEEVVTVWGANHTFHITVAADCGSSLLPEQLFRRVLTNLLTNAFRYTPPGGSVSLAMARSGEQLLIDVADTGIGIPDEEQNMIFEAFYRCGNIDSRHGLGLGLSIVNDALYKMNGSITFTSQVGVGTTFSLILPVG